MPIESIKNNFKRFGIGDNGDTVMPTLDANLGNIHSYYKANEVIYAYDHDFYNYQWSIISNNILDVLCTEYNSIIEKNGKDLFGNAELQQTFDYKLRDGDFKEALKTLFDNYIISAINKYDLVNKLGPLNQYTELKDENDDYDLEVGSIYEVICLTNTAISGTVNPLYGIYGYRTTDPKGYHIDSNKKLIFNKDNTGTKKDTQKLDSRLYFRVDSAYLFSQNSIKIVYSIWSNILDEARTYKPIDNSIDGVGISGRLMTNDRKITSDEITLSFGSDGSVGSNYKLVFSQYRDHLDVKTLERLFIRKIG